MIRKNRTVFLFNKNLGSTEHCYRSKISQEKIVTGNKATGILTMDK